MPNKKNLRAEFESAIAVFAPIREGQREFRIQTRLGALDVELHDDGKGLGGTWIAAVWDDLERAIEHFGRPLPLSSDRLGMTGKWNWFWFEQEPRWRHCTRAETVEAGRRMIAEFVEAVKRLRP